MINLIGLKNIVKPVNVAQNNLKKGFGYINLSQKSDTFERSNFTTCPINFTGKSNRLKEYQKLTANLNQKVESAQNSFNRQLATEGWSGKTADKISAIWNSKNRATLVQADIDSYKEQVKNLDNSIKTDTFKNKFKEMFEVEYDHSNISRFEKKTKQLEIALTTSCIANYTEEKLSKNIQIFNKNSGKLQDISEVKTNHFAQTGSIPYYTHTTTKEEVFENMENSLSEILGGKEVLDKILASNGFESEKTSIQDKYKAYGTLSNFIVESSKASAKEALKGQDLSQIKADYDKTYQKAFGTKNDIVARVENYNASQKAGASCVKFISNVILNTLGPSSVLASCAYSAGKSVAMDFADAKTKDVDKDIDMQKLLVNAGLSGVSGVVNRIIVNKYAAGVADKILAGKTQSNSVGSILRNFVVKEIISKEGVKLPAYGVEEVTNAVVYKMLGFKTSDKGVLNKKELATSMAVVAEAMTYLAIAKDNGKLNNVSQKEMVALLNEHINSSMKDDVEFNKWIDKNNATFQQMLNQLVKTELPKFDGKLKV